MSNLDLFYSIKSELKEKQKPFTSLNEVLLDSLDEIYPYVASNPTYLMNIDDTEMDNIQGNNYKEFLKNMKLFVKKLSARLDDEVKPISEKARLDLSFMSSKTKDKIKYYPIVIDFEDGQYLIGLARQYGEEAGTMAMNRSAKFKVVRWLLNGVDINKVVYNGVTPEKAIKLDKDVIMNTSILANKIAVLVQKNHLQWIKQHPNASINTDSELDSKISEVENEIKELQKQKKQLAKQLSDIKKQKETAPAEEPETPENIENSTTSNSNEPVEEPQEPASAETENNSEENGNGPQKEDNPKITSKDKKILDEIANDKVFKKMWKECYKGGIGGKFHYRGKYNGTHLLKLWNSLTPAGQNSAEKRIKEAIEYLKEQEKQEKTKKEEQEKFLKEFNEDVKKALSVTDISTPEKKDELARLFENIKNSPLGLYKTTEIPKVYEKGVKQVGEHINKLLDKKEQSNQPQEDTEKSDLIELGKSILQTEDLDEIEGNLDRYEELMDKKYSNDKEVTDLYNQITEHLDKIAGV